jgi:hypothetical protein
LANVTSIVGRLKGLKDTATTAQIDEIVEAVKVTLAAAEADHKRLVGQRRAILLEADDAAAAAHDALIAAAAREMDRAQARLEELAPRREKAAARERDAHFDALRKEARDLAASMTARLEPEYVEPATVIAAFVAEWKATHERLERIDRELREAGKSGVLAETPERLVRGRPGHEIPAQEVEEEVGGPSQWVEDPRTGEMRPVGIHSHEAPRKVKRTVPAKWVSGEQLPSLAGAVVLPPARIGGEKLWPR